MIILKTMANIGEYKKESRGIVISPEPKPKKPLIKPEKEIMRIKKMKCSGIKLSKFCL